MTRWYHSVAFLPVIAAPNVFAPAAGPHGYFVVFSVHALAVNHHPPTFLYSPLLLATAGEFRREEGSWEPEKGKPGKMAATHVPIPRVGSIKGCPLPEAVTLWGRLAVCVFPSDCLWRSSLQGLLKFSGVKCDGSEPKQGPTKQLAWPVASAQHGHGQPWTWEATLDGALFGVLWPCHWPLTTGLEGKVLER